MNDQQLFAFIKEMIDINAHTSQDEYQRKYEQLNKILRSQESLKQIMQIAIALEPIDDKILIGFINLIYQSIYYNFKAIKYSQFKLQQFPLIVTLLAQHCEKPHCYRRIQAIMQSMMAGVVIDDLTIMVSNALQLLTGQQDTTNYISILPQLQQNILLSLSVVYQCVFTRKFAASIKQQNLMNLKQHVMFPTFKFILSSKNQFSFSQQQIIENAVVSLTKAISGQVAQYIVDQLAELTQLVVTQHQQLNNQQEGKVQLKLAFFGFYDQLVKVYAQQKRSPKYDNIIQLYEQVIFQPLFQFLLNQLQNEDGNEDINIMIIQIITQNLNVFKNVNQIQNPDSIQLFNQLNLYITGKLHKYFEENVYQIDLQCSYNQRFDFQVDYNVELFNFLGRYDKKQYISVIINFYKEFYRSQYSFEQLVSMINNQINIIQSSQQASFQQIYTELITLMALISVINEDKQQNCEMIQQTMCHIYTFYIQTLQQIQQLPNYIALTFLQLIEQFLQENPNHTINQTIELLMFVFQYFKLVTQQTAFICSLIFIRRRVEHILIKTQIYLTSDEQKNQFNYLLMQNHSLVDLLKYVAHMMAQVEPEFMYYSELFQITSELTKILAPSYIDEVTELYEQIFKQLLQQNSRNIQNVQNSNQQQKLMKHFMNYMEIFSNVFINRYASIEGDTFIVYYQIITQYIYIYIVGYQIQQYDELKLLCTCLCYLLSNPSCVDVFQEICQSLLDLTNTALDFAIKNDKDNTSLVMQLIFTIADCFYVNDCSGIMYQLLYEKLKFVVSQGCQTYMRLFMLVRFCVSYLYTVEQGDVSELLTMYFSCPIDNSYVDCSFKTIYTMIYITLFKISIQCNQDLFQLEQFADLREYLFPHASIIPDNSLTKIYLKACYNYAERFNHLDQFKEIPKILSTIVYQKNTALNSQRYITNLNTDDSFAQLEGNCDLYELFQNASYLSIEIQHCQPFSSNIQPTQ